MQNAGFLFAAYSIIWLLLFAYVLGMAAKQRHLRNELESLKAERRATERKATPAPPTT